MASWEPPAGANTTYFLALGPCSFRHEPDGIEGEVLGRIAKDEAFLALGEEGPEGWLQVDLRGARLTSGLVCHQEGTAAANDDEKEDECDPRGIIQIVTDAEGSRRQVAYVKARNRFRDLVAVAPSQDEARARWEVQCAERRDGKDDRRAAPVGASLEHIAERHVKDGETAELMAELFDVSATIVAEAASSDEGLRSYSTSRLRNEVLASFRDDPARAKRAGLLLDRFNTVECFNQAIRRLEGPPKANAVAVADMLEVVVEQAQVQAQAAAAERLTTANANTTAPPAPAPPAAHAPAPAPTSASAAAEAGAEAEGVAAIEDISDSALNVIQSPLANEGPTFTLLHFVSVQTSVAVLPFVSREWNSFAKMDSFARFLCIRTRQEFRLYVPPRPPPGVTWSTVFHNDLWPLRHMWAAVVDKMGLDAEPTGGLGAPDAPTSGVGSDATLNWSMPGGEHPTQRQIADAYEARMAADAGHPAGSGVGGGGGGVGRDKSAASRYSLNVAVRFRPSAKHAKGDEDKENDLGGGRQFVLPLHQRLQLIRARARDQAPGDQAPNVSSTLKTLSDEGGWFSEEWKKTGWKKTAEGGAADGSPGGGSDNASSMVAHVANVDSGSGSVVAVAPGIGLREFSFDHALREGTSQGVVFEAAARQLITDFLNGYNATILVYGQTGSGKTFTMFGEPPAEFDDPSVLEKLEAAEMEMAQAAEPQQPATAAATAAAPNTACSSPEPPVAVPDLWSGTARGVVPRAAEEILAAVSERREQGIECELSMSYVEVFGDEVSDLLRQGRRCGHSKVAAQRYVLSGAATRPVHELADIHRLLAIGEARKRRAATAMNARSSRAHALVIMTLACRDEVSDKEVKSQLYLADLGGSEQVKRSEVHHGEMSEHHGHVLGDHMREAVYINLGLLALKKCIESLNKQKPYVPYQDSKLTMLLSPALGGDSKTSVVVCGSMDRENAKETVQALRFGEACTNVTNQATVGSKGAASLLAELEREMSELEAAIQKKERWETTRVVRKDALHEEGTFEAAMAKQVGGEVVNVGRVTGAEKERAALESIIVRRAKLLGVDPELKMAEMGFGGYAGSKASELGGNAEKRYANKSEGLKIKGRVVADWQV